MEEKRPCVSCGAPILSEALKCRHCGAMQAPAAPPSAARSNDEEQLNLLKILHYVFAAMKAFFACIPLIYVVIGLVLAIASSQSEAKDAPPVIVGVIFMAVGLLMSLVGWAFAACVYYAGRFIRDRRRLMFCQVVAAISCIFVPLGTALGIFSLVVLSRPSVQEMFKRERPSGV